MTAQEFGDRLLRRLLEHVVETVPGATGAGVGLQGRPRAATGVAADLDAAQWAAGKGPLVDALDGAPVVLPGPDGELSLPEPDASAVPAPGSPRGVVVVPGEWGGDAPLVLSVYLDRAPGAGELEQVDRLEPVLASALAVVEHCAGEELRAEQMLQMMQYRRVIEQAKGMVMGALGVDAAVAFQTLARASQHFNLRLRNLAVALVEHVGAAPAESPDDPSQVLVPSEHDRRVAAQVWAALTPSGAVTGDDPGPAAGDDPGPATGDDPGPATGPSAEEV